MAPVWRLARTFSSLRTIAHAKTLNSRPPLSLAAPLCNQLGSFEQQNSYRSVGQGPKVVPNFLVHTSLAGLLGYGMLDVAFADGDEAAAKSPTLAESAKSPALPKSAEGLDLPVSSESSALPESAKNDPPLESSPAASQHNLDEIARKDKARLEELIKSKGGTTGAYPRFTVSVKGTKVTIKFQVPPSAEIPFIIANLVSRLGVKAKDNVDGSEMILRAWDSGVAWQLVLAHPKTPKGAGGDQGDGKEKNSENEGLCILMFRPVISSDKAEIEFMKQSSFTFEELDALASILQYAGEQNRFGFVPRRDTAKVPTSDKTISSLEAMGVQIYGLKSSDLKDPNAEISWDTIAGYDDQKREIEDTILLALKSPEVYDDIARGTRCKFETNRPRAVLFEGPPGTGKTSCARAIANQARVPLLYVPLEIVVSKYYGESERLLGKVFSLANELQDGAIIFLDEVDSLATARDSDIHEATRRILSVLLRQIDGFEQQKKVVVIAATNRKQDLDPALLSRFDSMINFDLPDQQTREAIVAQYAKHLTKPEMSELARATEGMAGRDIRDVCQQAERNWASKIIRGQEQSSLPPLGEYIGSALKRRSAMLSVANQTRNPSPLWKKSQLDFI